MKIVLYRKDHCLVKSHTQYVERHHIIPKSLGGSNNPDNIVAVTAREHYILHELLVFHFKTIGNTRAYNKMLLAWNRLTHDKKGYFVTSRLYSQLKELNSQRARNFRHTNESKEKMRVAATGKKHSPESLIKLSHSLKGKTKPNSMKKKTSARSRNTTVVYNP